MKPPLRLTESTDANPFARSLLSAARRTEPIQPANRARGARHAARLAALPLASLGVGLVSKTVAAAFGAGFAGALTLVAISPTLRARLGPVPVVATNNSVPTRVTTSNVPASQPISPPVGSDVTPQAESAAGSQVPKPSPEQRLASVAHASATTTVIPAPSNLATTEQAPPVEGQGTGIAAELELVAAARERLASDPYTAQLLLDRHRELFPTGALAMEREILGFEVLERIGQRARAAAQAREFLAKPGNGFYASRLQRLIAEE
jgi:hypothetical protein